MCVNVWDVCVNMCENVCVIIMNPLHLQIFISSSLLMVNHNFQLFHSSYILHTQCEMPSSALVLLLLSIFCLSDITA